jgi:hypothetical protein
MLAQIDRSDAPVDRDQVARRHRKSSRGFLGGIGFGITAPAEHALPGDLDVDLKEESVSVVGVRLDRVHGGRARHPLVVPQQVLDASLKCLK